MVDRINCPKCGAKNENNREECEKCGIIFAKYEEAQARQEAARRASLMQCKTCGKEISRNAPTCPYCGEEYELQKPRHSQHTQDRKPQQVSITRVLILSIVGFFGMILIIGYIASNQNNKEIDRVAAFYGARAKAITQEYTISVGGEDGLEFSGHIMVIYPDGRNNSRSVAGTVPEKYTINGAVSVSCSFQKKTNMSSYLRVDVTNPIKSEQAETTAPYGVVTLAL